MAQQKTPIRVAELFAGVGGFRLGFERASSRFETVFSSQWEPPGTTKKQFASRCYVEVFGDKGHHNEDIEKTLDKIENGESPLPKVDLLCGGFPCQDYSVAKPLNQSQGLRGKKGVLWWQIHRMVEMYVKRKKPIKWLVLENVDRLLTSPAQQRGRDFAVMLASLSELGYVVEWRVVNAADYGRAQKRRRVFIVAYRKKVANKFAPTIVTESGILARAFPVDTEDVIEKTPVTFTLSGPIHELSQSFGKGLVSSPFANAGVIIGEQVWTIPVKAVKATGGLTLGDAIRLTKSVDSSLYLRREDVPKWEKLKGAKSEPRINKASGVSYHYKEGALPFPDRLDSPARTILTGEWGSSPSRFRHIVQDVKLFNKLSDEDKKGLDPRAFRRLTAEELEFLNDFPISHTKGPTDNPLSPRERAFCMGNALVVGLVQRIGKVVLEKPD
jgi:DNA (cytosine-5)-methyltransferase 1